MTKKGIEIIRFDEPDAAERIERVTRENQEIFDALVRKPQGCTCRTSKHPHDHITGRFMTGYFAKDLPPGACTHEVDIDTMGPQYYWRCKCMTPPEK